MTNTIVSIIGAVFNIVAIVLNAFGESKVAEVVMMILPEVNIIVVGILFALGFQANKALKAAK